MGTHAGARDRRVPLLRPPWEAGRTVNTLAEHWAANNDGDTVTYSAQELGLEDLGFVDTVDLGMDDGDALAWITASCSESLAFHREHSPDYFTEDGELTEEAFDALERMFRDRYDAGIYYADAEYFRFEIAQCTSGDSPADDVADVIWRPLAQIANELDPGTFGSPYVFGSLMAEYTKR